jgi:hypothetical protein
VSERKITLIVTRRPTFVVPDQPTMTTAQAIRHVVDGFSYGELTPDDEEFGSCEVWQVEVDGLEVRLDFDVDWKGPKTERGMHRWICRAYDGVTKLAEGFEVADVVDTALAVLRERAEAAS